MPIATDVRAYADAALKQGKTALSQASTAVNTATDRAVATRPPSPSCRRSRRTPARTAPGWPPALSR
jgi:hypothetical protein